MNKKELELVKSYCEKRFDRIDKQLYKLDDIGRMTKSVCLDLEATKRDNEDIQKINSRYAEIAVW